MRRKTQSAIFHYSIVIIAVMLIGYLIYMAVSSSRSVQPDKGYYDQEETSSMPSGGDISLDPLKRALDFPKPGSSTEEKEKHDALIRDVAVRSSRITISNCVSDPVVIRVALQDTIDIKNNDAVDRTMRHGFTSLVQIRAGSVKSIHVKDIFKGEGIFSYACGGGPISGIIVIVP